MSDCNETRTEDTAAAAGLASSAGPAESGNGTSAVSTRQVTELFGALQTLVQSLEAIIVDATVVLNRIGESSEPWPDAPVTPKIERQKPARRT